MGEIEACEVGVETGGGGAEIGDSGGGGDSCSGLFGISLFVSNLGFRCWEGGSRGRVRTITTTLLMLPDLMPDAIRSRFHDFAGMSELDVLEGEEVLLPILCDR